MRIFVTILWLILGLLVLWVARQNLETKVDLHLLHLSYTNLDLVTVIFFSVLAGLVFGGILFLSPMLGMGRELRLLRKEKQRLNRQIEEMTNNANQVTEKTITQ